MSKTAFIVKDHKTFMNAEEAWFKFKKEKSNSLLFILIPIGDPNNVVDTITQSLDEAKWEEVIWIKTLSNYDSKRWKEKKKKYWLLGTFFKYVEFIFNLIDVIRLNMFAKKFKNIEKIFTGHKNTQEHLTAKLNPKEVIIMDSGQTLDKIRASEYIDYRFSYYGSRLKTMLFKLTGLRITERKQVKLFTVYADIAETKHEIIKNSQEYKKHLIRNKSVGKKVIFISSPFYKFKEYIRLQAYVEYIESIIEHFHIDRSNFIYVPNPIREEKSDIQKIIKKLNCNVDDRLITVEAKVTTYDQLPEMCISPCSTALVNIDMLTGKKIKNYAAWHPEFDCFKVLVDWKSDVITDKNMNVNFEYIEKAPPLFNFKKKCSDGPIYRNLNDV